ncbi:hypothetical protein Tco_0327057 [Tanacetum coccineum]
MASCGVISASQVVKKRKERGHNGHPNIENVYHPIHDQTFYWTKKNIEYEYGRYRTLDVGTKTWGSRFYSCRMSTPSAKSQALPLSNMADIPRIAPTPISGRKSVKLTYASTRASNYLDNQLLHAMIVKDLRMSLKQHEIVGSFKSILHEMNVKVSFTKLSRTVGKQAVRVIVDKKPRLKTLIKIRECWGVKEVLVTTKILQSTVTYIQATTDIEIGKI